MRRLLVLLALFALAGCHDFRVPPEPEPPKSEVGTRCATDGDCKSGVCLAEHSNDAICCEKRCADDETCWAEGHVGSCELRLPGTKCVEERDCPQELACVDQVCCLAHCAPWQACNLPNHLGTCTNKNQFGGACALDAECPAPEGEGSGHCVKGVCCTSTCESWELCLPGGQKCASERRLGDTCSAAVDCPPPAGADAGFCVDGVCCDQACGETCHSCARQGLAGLCGPQDPNLDLRRECFSCGACFWGECEPAVPGTDPKDDCVGDRVCSVSGLCGLAGGASCVPGDSCAVGQCLEAACLVPRVEHVFVAPMSASARRRDVYAVAQNGIDEVSAIFEETETDVSGTRHSLYVAQRAADGTWRAELVDGCVDDYPYTAFAGGLVIQGRTAFIASYHSTKGNFLGCQKSIVETPPSGVWARQVAPGGALGTYENIDETVLDVYWVVLRALPAGGLAVAYLYDCPAGSCIRVRVREQTGSTGVPPSWKQVMELSVGQVAWDMAVVGGVPTLVVADGTTAQIYQPGADPLRGSVAFPADAYSCEYPAIGGLQAAPRSRVDSLTDEVEEGLLFVAAECPLSMFRTQARVGTWWASRGAFDLESLDTNSLFGVALGGPRGAVGMVEYDDDLLSELHHTWVDADQVRQSQFVFLPPGFEDIATSTGTACLTPTGSPTYLVATGDRAVAPVPRELYLITLRR